MRSRATDCPIDSSFCLRPLSSITSCFYAPWGMSAIACVLRQAVSSKGFVVWRWFCWVVSILTGRFLSRRRRCTRSFQCWRLPSPWTGSQPWRQREPLAKFAYQVPCRMPSVMCFWPSKLMMTISSILVLSGWGAPIERLCCLSWAACDFWLHYRFGFALQHSYLSKCDNDYSFRCWAALTSQCSSDFNHSFCRSIDRLTIVRCFIC